MLESRCGLIRVFSFFIRHNDHRDWAASMHNEVRDFSVQIPIPIITINTVTVPLFRLFYLVSSSQSIRGKERWECRVALRCIVQKSTTITFTFFSSTAAQNSLLIRFLSLFFSAFSLMAIERVPEGLE